MAGHRNGRPRRTDARRERMSRRLSSATTAEEQLAAAYDWFRMALRHAPVAVDRSGSMRRAAELLASLAAELDGRP